MTARRPTAAHSKTASSAGPLLLELEMPRTTAFEVFETQLERQLAQLEARFSGFVTHNSLVGSIGR